MKLFLIFTAILFVSTAGEGYILNRVDGITGNVEGIDFDSEGNIYVATYVWHNNKIGDVRDAEDHKLFKLSPTRELLWMVELPPPIDVLSQMSVTSYGDVYFSFWNSYDTTPTTTFTETFAILRSGSDKVEVIEDIAVFPYDFFFLDSNDNLLYARGDNSIYVLKPNATEPVLIKGLDNCTAYVRPGYGVEDSKGNVYVAVFNENDFNPYVALLTKESLEEDVPQAELIPATSLPRQRILDLVVDKKDDLWVIVNIDYETGYVRKLINGTVETIRTDPNHPDLEVTAANDRIFVVGGNMLYEVAPIIYYVTLDNEVVDIPELDGLTPQMFFLSDSAADKEGNFYSKTFNIFSPEFGSMIAITANESKPVPIRFEDPDEVLDDLYMDDHGDVWIMTNNYNIYSVKKGETVATALEEWYGGICNNVPVVTNPVTQEVYVSCDGGVYVALNKK